MSSAASSDVKEVQVRFVTKLETKVPEGGFSVPVRLARYGLSEIVNHLLSQDPPRPYDFLIEGEFLRTDIAKYLESKRISGEAGLTLEYVEAMPAPEELPSRPHPDWISSVDGSVNGFLLTGCYDGRVRILHSDQSVPLAVCGGHTSAVKAVRFMAGSTGAAPMDESEDGKKGKESKRRNIPSNMFVSASKDRTLRVWKKVVPVAVCTGHDDSVESVDVLENGSKFVSGGWDKRVMIWDISDVTLRKNSGASGSSSSSSSGSGAGSGDSAPASKKRKTGVLPGDKKSDDAGAGADEAADSESKGSLYGDLEQGPLAVLEGHAAAVSAVVWPSPFAVYSGSWDHSIRHWDAKTLQNVSTWTGNKVVTALSFSLLDNLIASGHNDNIVRIWDPRRKENDVAQLSLKSHKGWVTAVAWHPETAHMLASSSHDGTVKIWDVRSSVPLFTLKAHKDKALCVSWQGSRLASGGADAQLHMHKLALASKSASKAEEKKQ